MSAVSTPMKRGNGRRKMNKDADEELRPGDHVRVTAHNSAFDNFTGTLERQSRRTGRWLVKLTCWNSRHCGNVNPEVWDKTPFPEHQSSVWFDELALEETGK